MKFREVYKTLESNKLYIFSSEELLLLYPGETKENLKKLLYRWRQKGWVNTLKRGLFELVYPRSLNIPDLYIANKVYQPSYVSLETALSYYSIIPEVSMAVTSITTKPTRRYRNHHGLFVYRTVGPEAYNGYHIESIHGFQVLIAEPEKAFVDYLHFKTLGNKKLRLSGERFDRKKIKALRQDKLNGYARPYRIDIGDACADL